MVLPQLAAPNVQQVSFQLEEWLHALHARQDVPLAPVAPQQAALNALIAISLT